ncbi:MAG: hypothetical protein V4548_04055 [Bacteroidota bacterium]
MKNIIILGLISAFIFSCKNENKIQNVERAFYYWKSNESELNKVENKIIDTLKIKKMYVKFFEVKFDETMGNIPVSKSNLNEYFWRYDEKPKDSLKIIPTVFIKNEVFLKSNKEDIDTLASNVKHLVSKYYKEKFSNYFDYNEIQIDCDWTIKSKDNYFYFLKQLAKVSKKELSCTLRLYPYKYRTKMGVPPVNKVTLMCYNLIQPFADRNKNSILDNDELDSYLSVDKKYPLHLDIALPLFSWGHHYQYDQFKGFVVLDKSFLNAICDKKNEFWYEVKKDTTFDDVYYRIGDKIKYEDVSFSKIDKAINSLKEKCKFDKNTTVTFFHLDSTITKKIKYETLNNFYTSFSK